MIASAIARSTEKVRLSSETLKRLCPTCVALHGAWSQYGRISPWHDAAAVPPQLASEALV